MEEARTRAEQAFERRDWLSARDAYRNVQGTTGLAGDDAFKLADCVWWLGAAREAQGLYGESHDLYVKEGRPRKAALSAFAAAGLAFMRGEPATGSGWAGRAMRLLENEPVGPEHGFALFMDLSGTLAGGDLESAIAKAQQLQAMGRTFADPNLSALGILCEGQALIKQGSVQHGMRLLDEAMLLALSNELAPEWAGNIYCQLMVTCHELGDLPRAREWTQATARWCDTLTAKGPFAGVCRVHRAQVFQMEGHWAEAALEAGRACEELAEYDVGTVAEARYQIGEVRRLQGDFASAEAAYRQAHLLGREPQPGLSLLRCSQGHATEALASIQTALTGAPNDRLSRAWLSVAQVEIALAAGDEDAAQIACSELLGAATDYDSTGLQAAAEQSRGMLLMATGNAAEALPSLREACLRWQRLSVPYEVARVRTWLAKAYEALGDKDAATLELDAAEHVFTSLGALPDAARTLIQRNRPTSAHGLTAREAEVLKLLSSGQTNRMIAAALFISEKTVARHLTNIYTKLGISSRTEATRFAFEHELTQEMGKTSYP